MTAFFCQVSWGRAAGAVGLLLGCWVGGTGAFGQEVGDTTGVEAQPETRGAPPAPLDSVQTEDVASPDTNGSERAIVSADSLSAMTREGERLQELFTNVKVRQDTTRLRSNYGVRYLNRSELLFTGDVVIYERGDTLRADTVWYNKQTKVGRARSNVRLTDGDVVIRAPKAVYYTDEKRSVFPDSVRLVDSSRVLRAREGTYWSDERRAEFSGDVELTDPETYLESDSLAYYRDQERSIATGSVFIRRADTTAGASDTTAKVADTTATIGDTTATAADTSTATVDTTSVAADTTSITYLFGEWGDNQEQNRYSRVEEQALLVRVRMDSTGAPDDTLAVRAHRLEAKRTDTYRRLVAVDSVRIWQADLAAVADSAVYNRIIARGESDTTSAPAPLPDTTTGAPGDTTDTYNSRLDSLVARVELAGTGPLDPPTGPPPGAESRSDDVGPARSEAIPDSVSRRGSRRRAGVQDRSVPDSGASDRNGGSGTSAPGWGRPVVQPGNALPLEETRLFRDPITWFEHSQVWGDSIRVRARNRSLDTVYVRGASFAAQNDTTVDRIRQLKGKNITAFFRRDSLRRIQARPNGEAIYFSASETGELDGATRASADHVDLYFRQGDVQRIKFGKGVQGKAYHKKQLIPDPFRLEGFQWTPERRPTKARLLREERVRERLGLDSLDRAQTRRPSPVTQVPTDSAAPRLRRKEVDGAPPTPDAQPAQRRERRSPQPDSLSSLKNLLRTGPDQSSSSTPGDTTESFNRNP